jgi:hypothetical protein
VIDPHLAAQLRKMFLKSCVDTAHFDRGLSLELDHVIAAIEELEC